jgi:hypothetical protein
VGKRAVVHGQMDKNFCFFFQKEALSFLKKRNKKLFIIWSLHDPGLCGPGGG